MTKKKQKYGDFGTKTAHSIFPLGHPGHGANSNVPVETLSESKETRTREIRSQTLDTRVTVRFVQQLLYDVDVPNFRSYILTTDLSRSNVENANIYTNQIPTISIQL